jgi:hypothetical protein
LRVKALFSIFHLSLDQNLVFGDKKEKKTFHALAGAVNPSQIKKAHKTLE